MMSTAVVELEDGWEKITKGAIERLQQILEQDLVGHKFDNTEYMTYYTLVYNMCTQKPPHNYSEQLYERYRLAISKYLNTAVLPSVREKTGQYMLQEVGKRWSHHKINVRWMRQFFCYLVRRLHINSSSAHHLLFVDQDRFHTKRLNLPNMRDVGALATLNHLA